MTVSVVIPSRRGGPLLTKIVEAIHGNRRGQVAEILLVDSGSDASHLEQLKRAGASIHQIAADSFDHGLTRDRGARQVGGEILVFLNQDALPAGDDWIDELTAPFFGPDAPAAVQGGIREFPRERAALLGLRRFFWDSCGPRFYFTSESERWITRYGGIGFSTVNCAIARWAWEAEPFGRAAILEDKIWQKRATERGWTIAAAPGAAVWHTHDYDLRGLLRRCASEGYGWRLVGEKYSLLRAASDLLQAPWREWRRGWRSGEMATPAERLFPLVRPLALWWGNRWATRIYT